MRARSSRVAKRTTKKGDNAWGPLRPPRSHDSNWPTVVLEIAVSESQLKLQSDVRFWLWQGQGKVNIAFTLTVDRQNPGIWIEKWESAGDREHRTQQVTVYRGANNRIYTTGDPLTIEFPKLFLRNTSCPKEAYIQFPQDVLENLAIQFGSLRSLMSETSPSFVLILASYSTIPTIERSTAGQ